MEIFKPSKIAALYMSLLEDVEKAAEGLDYLESNLAYASDGSVDFAIDAIEEEFERCREARYNLEKVFKTDYQLDLY